MLAREECNWEFYTIVVLCGIWDIETTVMATCAEFGEQGCRISIQHSAGDWNSKGDSNIYHIHISIIICSVTSKANLPKLRG